MLFDSISSLRHKSLTLNLIVCAKSEGLSYGLQACSSCLHVCVELAPEVTDCRPTRLPLMFAKSWSLRLQAAGRRPDTECAFKEAWGLGIVLRRIGRRICVRLRMEIFVVYVSSFRVSIDVFTNPTLPSQRLAVFILLSRLFIVAGSHWGGVNSYKMWIIIATDVNRCALRSSVPLLWICRLALSLILVSFPCLLSHLRLPRIIRDAFQPIARSSSPLQSPRQPPSRCNNCLGRSKSWLESNRKPGTKIGFRYDN